MTVQTTTRPKAAWNIKQTVVYTLAFLLAFFGGAWLATEHLDTPFNPKIAATLGSSDPDITDYRLSCPGAIKVKMGEENAGYTLSMKSGEPRLTGRYGGIKGGRLVNRNGYKPYMVTFEAAHSTRFVDLRFPTELFVTTDEDSPTEVEVCPASPDQSLIKQ